MEYRLTTPVPQGEIRLLKTGDVVYLNGTIITARDEAHLKALDLDDKSEKLPVDFNGVGIFHCGPIMKRVDGEWKVVAAGPTTSARMEIFQDKFIERFRPAIIIGKGGMGEKTAKACEKYGCVYGAFTGGAALLAAKGIKRVNDVFWLEELGMPECLWVFDVQDFGPMIVTIDTHGNNMTDDLIKQIQLNKKEILESLEG